MIGALQRDSPQQIKHLINSGFDVARAPKLHFIESSNTYSYMTFSVVYTGRWCVETKVKSFFASPQLSNLIRAAAKALLESAGAASLQPLRTLFDNKPVSQLAGILPSIAMKVFATLKPDAPSVPKLEWFKLFATKVWVELRQKYSRAELLGSDDYSVLHRCGTDVINDVKSLIPVRDLPPPSTLINLLNPNFRN